MSCPSTTNPTDETLELELELELDSLLPLVVEIADDATFFDDFDVFDTFNLLLVPFDFAEKGPKISI